MSDLSPAHRGYEYQDLLVAARLIDVLLGIIVRVEVDKKTRSEDVFDDLTVIGRDGVRSRTQFKHRDSEGVPLSLGTFTTQSRSLRLDHLVDCALADRAEFEREASTFEFRLVLRDAAPEDPRVVQLLQPASNATPFLAGMHTALLRFDVDTVWPRTAKPGQQLSEADPFAFIRDGKRTRDDVTWVCQHLLVEVNAPIASFDLSQPGPAEQVLLDRIIRDVGAGYYPNKERQPTDVAHAVISVARAARLQRVVVSQELLLSRTRIRHDFGAVARSHPVDDAIQVPRASAVENLVRGAEDAADKAQVLLVVGPPGHGKSWTCHQLQSALLQGHWLVAEHYCFLSAGDEHLEARVLTDAVYGSLLARLAAANPSIVSEQRPRFAADEHALLEAIRRALSTDPDLRVALIVDGLDHVARVLRGAAASATDPSLALAEHLASLSLLPRSTLIVLSQPGLHLRPFRDAGSVTVDLPSLTETELGDLAGRLDVLPADEETDREQQNLIEALGRRSGGNALYATYICRELKRTERVSTPVEAINAMPPYDDTLGNYYNYLISTLDNGGGTIADVIALLDFAVTRAELREVLPEVARHVEATLARLQPVLIERTSQGGVRVYHESFSRFLRGNLERDETTRRALLDKVAAWLTGKGLFTDRRAFRSLIPTLASANRHADVLQLIGTDFASRAIAASFSSSAIKSNLACAIASARAERRWPSMARFIELGRAAESFDEERLESTLLEFAAVPLALVGPAKFGECLLDDGQPTIPPRAGLKLCNALDAAGGTAPWREYLDTLERKGADNVHHGEDSERDLLLAWFRGRLRTAEGPADPERVSNWLTGTPLPWGDVTRTICDTHGLDFAEAVAVAAGTPGEMSLSVAETIVVTEAVAARTTTHARRALERGVPVGNAHRLLRLGIDAEQLRPAIEGERERLFALTRSVQAPGSSRDWSHLSEWLDGCAIAARRDRLSLASAEALIVGPGWYRCWLRFCAALCMSEAHDIADTRANGALAALELLRGDLDPFTGDPRACDLYQIHGVIASTLRRALALLNDANWGSGAAVLREVSGRVTTSLRRELGGPVSPILVLELLLEFTTPARKATTQQLLLSVAEEARAGRYYSDIAGLHLVMAKFALACQDKTAAQRHWDDACVMMTAYTWRKDTTIFELLDPLEVLVNADTERARDRLIVLQPLCWRVVNHTDGKGTRRRYVRELWIGPRRELRKVAYPSA